MSSLSVSPSIVSPLFCGWLTIVWLFAIVAKSLELPWIRLTGDNFSSEIHTHPFILGLATVPWCGESRSLMRELSMSLSTEESLQSVIQLRVVYLNVDKDLQIFFSQSARRPSFTFFWHSNPLKYKGKLRLQNILTAINHAVELRLQNFPIKKLGTALELENFMGSTDKAVVLFDFCNYRNKIQESKDHLLVEKPFSVTQGSVGNGNEGQARKTRFVEVSKTQCILEMPYKEQRVSYASKDPPKLSPEHSAVQEYVEVNSTVMSREIDARHGMLLEGAAKGNKQLTSENVSQNRNPIGNDDNGQDRVITCEPETEFVSLNAPSFFRDKQSIGEYKSKKSWLKDNVRNGVLIQGEVCNNTEFNRFAKVYQQLIKIATAHILTPELANFAVIEDKGLLSTWGSERMQNHTWFLMQWMPDWPNLPRLYHGNESLQTFLIGPNQLVNELSQESIDSASDICNNTIAVVLFIDKVSPVPEVRTKSWEAITALRAFALDQVKQESLEIQSRTNMDFQMESKQLFQSGHSKFMIEIQTPKGKDTNLKSLLGRDVLLEQTDQSNKVSKSPSNEESSLHSPSFAIDSDARFKLLVEGNGKQKSDGHLLKENLQEIELGKLLLSQDSAIFEIQEEKILDKVGAASMSHTQEDLRSLLSSNIDGEDQWKDMVHPALPYPSLVILDPLQQGKFIFPTVNQSLNYTSLKTFFNRFSAKKLEKVYLSDVAQREPRKHVEPPFVNRDFHEVDGVPHVNAHRLRQLLHQRSMLYLDPMVPIETKHGFMERAALVLYTAPSCGFCKRMELVFREVHHLFMRHLDWNLGEGFMRPSHSLCDENVDVVRDSILQSNAHEIEGGRLPHLFQIDCTMNDCGDFFQSIEQDELYPSVVLYPAQSKNYAVMFEGLPTVQEILKFIAVEGEVGTSVLSYLKEGTKNKRSDTNKHMQTGDCPLSQSSQSIVIGSRSSNSRHVYQFEADIREKPSSFLESNNGNRQNAIKPIIYPTVGSVLLATEQLSNASKAFQNSKILIIKADGIEGFQGLIFNKPLAWDRLAGLLVEMELLVNRTVLFYGGPVILEGEPFVSLSRLKDMEGYSEVIPGVYAGGPAATMHVFHSIKAGRVEAADFWFFLGHAVWGWQQLLNEIDQQFWNLTSLEEGTFQLPIHEWLEGSSISFASLL